MTCLRQMLEDLSLFHLVRACRLRQVYIKAAVLKAPKNNVMYIVLVSMCRNFRAAPIMVLLLSGARVGGA